ncbi:SafA/ExsA family spore coat assembly protein [Aquibacillus koreensis]|uniref:SafA/ExsA family spore coat assembly protein n=1 Tax=Aquibacillus koreensis TaxID=279446 RepID=A0A9X3WKV0_9BACI|nr:SafA/ExsA family spore coat assembly protein [Aquibacillus koreensis]MCT2537975.1 SafA/ExsA family spore coat assembly protein [Aquibacillus koreensis]MDC3419134.1 SafA/ExsA family spore coat assembly protein [Aquibacillus koreensis]
MKIHVVQKGETLWKIAQKYGVDFEELKQMNSHLSNPDMIMPGMKIKVPTTTKQVKKEQPTDKEMKKYPAKKETQKPYKDTSPKPQPVMKEDDYKKPSKEKKSLPTMPTMEQQIENYPTSVNMPKMPHFELEKNEYNIDVDQTNIDQEKTTVNQFTQAAPTKQVKQPHYMPQQPMMPVNYYHPMPHCIEQPKPCGKGQMMPYAMQQPTHAYQHGYVNPGYEQVQPTQAYMPPMYGNVQPTQEHVQPTMPFNQDSLMESSSSLEMPQMPENLAGVYEQEYPTENAQYPNYGVANVPSMYGQGNVPAHPYTHGYGQMTPSYGQGPVPGHHQVQVPYAMSNHGTHQQAPGVAPFGFPQPGYGYPQQPGMTPGYGNPNLYTRDTNDNERE